MNTNVLAGMACPECKSEGPFLILASAYAEVSDQGVTDVDSFEWDEESNCKCTKCEHKGTVQQFHAAPVKSESSTESL